MASKVLFVDLKAQYQNIKAEIDAAVAAVIQETAFIKGKYVEIFEKTKFFPYRFIRNWKAIRLSML